jgi:aspartyl-tRNA(Asn)/glutamyl-tRNA(Gln) amidotransferase subunit B
MIAEAREALPELPAERQRRYEAELGLPPGQARQLAHQAELGEYFERALEAGDGVEATALANWVTGELVARIREAGAEDPAETSAEPRAVAALVAMVAERRISSGAGKEVLAELVRSGGDPTEIVERQGLAQISDAGELEEIVARAIEADPDAAEKVRSGNERAIGAIVGAVMKETKGRADGGEVQRLIREHLGL